MVIDKSPQQLRDICLFLYFIFFSVKLFFPTREVAVERRETVQNQMEQKKQKESAERVREER